MKFSRLAVLWCRLARRIISGGLLHLWNIILDPVSPTHPPEDTQGIVSHPHYSTHKDLSKIWKEIFFSFLKNEIKKLTDKSAMGIKEPKARLVGSKGNYVPLGFGTSRETAITTFPNDRILMTFIYRFKIGLVGQVTNQDMKL